MEYVLVGEIINTFGIRGELKIESLTDFPEMRFKADNTLYIKYNNQYLPFVSKSYRVHKGFVLLLLKDHENINLVEKYKGCNIYVSKDNVHILENGEYYYFQLQNCDVYYQNKKFGVVSSVESGYQSILRIQSDEGKEVLIPYVKAFVTNVDINNKRIDVNLIEGML